MKAMTAGGRLGQWLPGAALLFRYERSQFRHDALAALVVALVTIPSAFAYESPKSPQWLPALGWLRAYDGGWLRGDVVAGITLAASLATQPERFYRNSINEPTKP